MPDAPHQSGGGAALDALQRALEAQPHGTILVTAPASPERRRLLEALPAQLGARFTSVWLEASDLSPAVLWMRITEALGVTPGYDARRRVLQLVENLVLRSGGLLVIVPDAETMAGDSLASLVNNARTERGLHVVLASGSARSLAGPAPEDATVVAWDDDALAEPPPRAPARVPAEVVAELPAAHVPEIAPGPPRRAVHEERRSLPSRGVAVLLAAGLALVLAWSLYPSGRVEPAEEEPVATRVAPPPSEPEPPREELPSAEPLRADPPREAAAAVDPSREPAETPGAAPPPSEVEATAAPEPVAAPEAPPAAEPGPRAEPIAGGEAGEARSETAAARESPPSPPREPDASPSPAPVAPSAQSPQQVAPSAEPPPSEPAAAVPAEPRPAEPEVARAPRPAEPPPPAPAAPPLARGRLRVDSEVPVHIEIDGRPHGRTPLDDVRLPRGPHRVVARYPDGAAAQKSVILGDEDVAIFFR